MSTTFFCIASIPFLYAPTAYVLNYSTHSTSIHSNYIHLVSSSALHSFYLHAPHNCTHQQDSFNKTPNKKLHISTTLFHSYTLNSSTCCIKCPVYIHLSLYIYIYLHQAFTSTRMLYMQTRTKYIFFSFLSYLYHV